MQAVPPLCPACKTDVDPRAPHCRCTHPVPIFTAAAGEYGGELRQAVLRLKFGGYAAGAPALAALMSLRIAQWLPSGALLVPVPLHRDRERDRGYNQAALLAQELAALTGTRYAPHALHRVRSTSAQSRLDAHERRRNVEHAFTGTAQCMGQDIVVIDDVCTTGATLRAVSLAARDAGAVRVTSAVLALTTGRH